MEEILVTATTTLPLEFFDELLADLDSPGEPSPALVEAVARLRDTVIRD